MGSAPSGTLRLRLPTQPATKWGVFILLMDSLYGTNWIGDRKAALRRDGHKCVYCGSRHRLQVHHIRPLTRGGTNDVNNLVTLCHDCHVGQHADIRAHGLATIPSPDFEASRYELTNETDVLRYADYLDSIGIDGDYLRGLERNA